MFFLVVLHELKVILVIDITRPWYRIEKATLS